MTADEADEKAEETGLGDATENIVEGNLVDDGIHKEDRVDIELQHCDHHAAKNPHGIGNHRQEGKHQRDGGDLRHDQLFDVIAADGAQGIDLLRHFHGAQFRRHAGAHTPPHQQGGDHRSQLSQDR